VEHAGLAQQLESLHPDSFGWALACCDRRREDAEDLLHDVYMMVLEDDARFEGRSTFKTWLFGVIRRVSARTHYHRGKARMAALLSEDRP